MERARNAVRHALVEAKPLGNGADDADLDGEQAAQQRDDDGPLGQQEAQVHRRAGGHEEQPQQQRPERPDVRLNLQQRASGPAAM